MPRTDGLKKAQRVYERGALAAERHIAVTLKLKTEDDVAAFKALRDALYPATDTAIVRQAVRELAKRKLAKKGKAT